MIIFCSSQKEEKMNIEQGMINDEVKKSVVKKSSYCWLEVVVSFRKANNNCSLLKKGRKMEKDNNRVCPVWMAYTFDNPLRKLIHNPKKMFKEYVKEEMTVTDIGCGLGFFSIGLARMVGKKGKVYSVNLQKGMLDRLMKRAGKANVADIIKTHQCSADKIGIENKLDFALAFWMIHETPNPEICLKQIYDLLKPDGILFLSEPKHHISKKYFEKMVNSVQKIGFQIISKPKIIMSRTVVLSKEQKKKS